MSSFFSKYLGKIALMVAAVLWSGCSNVDKDSKNEKSLNASNSFGVAELSNPVESSYSAALQDVKEKDSRDSLMKAFFPVERIGNVCKDNVYAGLRYDIGNLLKYGSVKKYGCIRRTRVNTSRGVIYVGVPEEYGLRSYPFPKDFVHPFSMTSELSVVGLVNAVKFKSNATAKVLLENIKSAGISLDMINICYDELHFISENISADKIEKIISDLGFKYSRNDECAKVMFLGVGIKGVPGIMDKIFEAFDSVKVDIMRTTDSHTTISCLINSSKIEKVKESAIKILKIPTNNIIEE